METFQMKFTARTPLCRAFPHPLTTTAKGVFAQLSAGPSQRPSYCWACRTEASRHSCPPFILTHFLSRQRLKVLLTITTTWVTENPRSPPGYEALRDEITTATTDATPTIFTGVPATAQALVPVSTLQALFYMPLCWPARKKHEHKANLSPATWRQCEPWRLRDLFNLTCALRVWQMIERSIS